MHALLLLALALQHQDKPTPPPPPKLEVLIQRARELAAVRMLPIIHWCEGNQLYGEGKGLCLGILMILPEHKEVLGIMRRNPWDGEIPENHYKGKVKELLQFRASCRAAFYEILHAYDAAALVASKGTLDKRADPIYNECDMLVLGSNLLEPTGNGRPTKIKGLAGDFSEQVSRSGVTIVTDLPSNEQMDLIFGADDAIEAYLHFLDGHAKGLRLAKLPAMKIFYFQDQVTLDEYCKLNDIPNPGSGAFCVGPASYYRLDKSNFGISGLILHQAPRLLDPFLLPKTVRATQWITEGFSCYLQSAQRYGLRIQLNRKDRMWEFCGTTAFFDLDAFCDWSSDQFDAAIKETSATAVHGQASALFRYLLQLREGAIRDRVIEDMVVAGKSGTASLCEILGVKSLKEIEADFKTFANTLYRQKIQ